LIALYRQHLTDQAALRSLLRSPTATITIGVLAAVVALLIAFIIWRSTKRRNAAKQHAYNTTSVNPSTSQPAGGVYAAAAPYKEPPVVVYKRPGAPRTPELSGYGAQRPIYETGPAPHIELDATNYS
jgi:hypothetical protein